MNLLSFATGFLRTARCPSAAALAFGVLASCASPQLPKVKLAPQRAGLSKQTAFQHESLARDLAALQAAPLLNNSFQTEQFVLHLQRKIHVHDWKQPVRIEGKAGAWELQFNTQPLSQGHAQEWPPAIFDRLLPASAFKLDHYQHIASGAGTGAPVVLAYEDIQKLREQRSFRPSNGQYVPGTVVLEFGTPNKPGDPTPVRCRVINSFEQRTLSCQRQTVPLAWNLTAAVEANLANTYIQSNGLIGLLRPNQRRQDVGVFGLEVYDPRKTPVLFIHGLDSSPAIWSHAINEIYANPRLSERYQPLLFMYPTGLSVPASAAKLRRSIEEYRDYWDPQHRAPGFNNMILVGHSMGGLLSRLQVIDSGDELWRAFFTKPVSDIPWLSENDRSLVETSLKFKPLPYVRRVIFVCVPHRGSRMADIGLVRLLVRLIQLPDQITSFIKIALTDDISMFNPALMNYHSLGLRSVDMLSPGHPYFEAINKRPITVPYHSIIGDRGKRNLPCRDTTDGVVPYWSSHLEGARSEKRVPYGHSCTLKPEVVEEITRILREQPDGMNTPKR